jgi:hypothetical protein
MTSQIPEKFISMSQESPEERLHNLFSELTGRMTTLRGYAEIFGNSLNEQSKPPIELMVFQKEFARIGQEFINIRNSFFEEEKIFALTEEDVLFWRKRFLVPAKELMDLAIKMESAKNVLAETLPDLFDLAEIFQRVANYIWMTIDVLTNPDFQPPPEKSD